MSPLALQTAQRWLVMGLVFLLPIAILRGAADPFHLPKATLVVVMAVAVVALEGAKTIARPFGRRPPTALLIIVGLLALGATLSTVTSVSPTTSFFGEYTYYSGLLSMLSHIALLLVIVRTFDLPATDGVLVSVAAASTVVVGYGLLQLLGADPLAWDAAVTGVFATLGNPNFAAGWLAIAFPAVAYVAVSDRRGPTTIWAARILAALLVVVIVGTASFQGPIALVAGLAAFAVVSFGGRLDTVGWKLGAALLVVGTVVTGLIAGGFLRDQLAAGFDERRLMWVTAFRVFRSSPLFGSGLDTYGLEFLARRPAEHAARFGATNPEQAHSVPLDLLADGGLAVLLPYLAFVSYAAWELWRSWRITDDRHRLLLGGVAGMWVAYQTQSLVSIDVPANATMHWIAAAGMLVASYASRSASTPAPRQVKVSGATTGAQWATVLSGVVLIWFVLIPLGADLAAARGVGLVRQGQIPEAVSSLERATDLVGYRASYWGEYAVALANAGQIDEARDVAARAAALDFGSAQVAIFNAQLALSDDDASAAWSWFDEAADRDPKSVQILRQIATILTEAGRTEEAASYLERADAMDTGATTS